MNASFAAAAPLLEFGTTTITTGHAASAIAFVAFIAGLLFLRSRRRRVEAEDFADALEAKAEDDARQLSQILKAQTEMQGRIAAMTEMFGARQAEFNQNVNQRLDGMTQRIGATISEQTRATHENLRRLQERLAVIDTAQTNIQTLARDIVSLQSILSNKQTRGAFGQGRMEAIIADALPQGAYRFQATLSNGARPDCLIRMPNSQPSLVIDAKFPLEAWNAMRDGGPERVKAAGQQFRRDMEIHIRDIASKYLLPGETQDTAFMFVPSESIFADMHERFESITHTAHRSRVVIVSPSLLLLSIQLIQSMLKDQRMREQAHVIQAEVIGLMEDLGRLDERVRKLQGHFLAAQKDVDLVIAATDKVSRRGQKIEAMEFETPGISAEAPVQKTAESKTGLLKLRLVDED
ncbi:DNA recombination protein RmuC [Rhizobium sp. SG_E_25_P2]|uniref:DNA recombination protein RmuC n=1 Tax=Rhizobium sp. SG_E_25_P2 TaxID=2879942 RepID=UPI002474A77C|nr:DNA recombination protein RmuC [Rhizobium sp. SG_E_25_P2]MDH6264889.1 DNA recombination protein RmuC [Rhizobium sp. SG_E_25_P2]